MKSKLTKGLLASALTLAFMVPAMALNTTVTINATVEDVVQLQLETNAGVIVSGDDVFRQAGAPGGVTGTSADDEVLEFGLVDPYAISEGGTGAGAYTSANNLTVGSGSLDKQLMVDDGTTMKYQDEATYDTTGMVSTDGAVYFVDGGYQLRATRSGAQPTEIEVEADTNGTDPALDAIVAIDANFAATQDVTGMVDADGVAVPFIAALAHNTPQLIDLGVRVPISTAADSYSTVITFRGN